MKNTNPITKRALSLTTNSYYDKRKSKLVVIILLHSLAFLYNHMVSQHMTKNEPFGN